MCIHTEMFAPCSDCKAAIAAEDAEIEVRSTTFATDNNDEIVRCEDVDCGWCRHASVCGYLA